MLRCFRTYVLIDPPLLLSGDRFASIHNGQGVSAYIIQYIQCQSTDGGATVRGSSADLLDQERSAGHAEFNGPDANLQS